MNINIINLLKLTPVAANNECSPSNFILYVGPVLEEMLTRIADKTKDGLLNTDEIQVALAQCGVIVDKKELPFLKTALDSDSK